MLMVPVTVLLASMYTDHDCSGSLWRGLFFLCTLGVPAVIEGVIVAKTLLENSDWSE